MKIKRVNYQATILNLNNKNIFIINDNIFKNYLGGVLK